MKTQECIDGLKAVELFSIQESWLRGSLFSRNAQSEHRTFGEAHHSLRNRSAEHKLPRKNLCIQTAI